MRTKFLLKLINAIALVAVILGYVACANRGAGPQGGPKDEVPPMVIKTIPVNNATGVSQNTIVIEFDELVSLENPGKNIVFSPPQKEVPSVKLKGRKIVITYEDSLRPNTTYTIDFRNAIVDLNEKNPLSGYIYQFSTGDHIDSLQISGHVLHALNLKPRKNFTVGIYQDKSDTAFLTRPFDRISRTNDEGEFTIRNIAPGSYQLFALDDPAQSNFYQQMGVEIAFSDSIIIPEAHLHGTFDTLWKDPAKTAYDSVIINAFYKYYPNDIILKTFKEKRIQHFLKKQIRPRKELFILIFNEPQPQKPTIQLLDDTLQHDSAWYVQERSHRVDSLVCWIQDSTILNLDTLKLKVAYTFTDTALQNVPKEDTLYLSVRPSKQKKKKKATKADSILYQFNHNLGKNLEVYDTIKLRFTEPILNCVPDSIHLYQVVDTLEVPVPLYLQYDYDPCPRQVSLLFKKEFGESYQLRIDSAAFFSWYGKVSKPFNKPVKIKALEEYANLYVQFPKVPQNARVQIMNKNQKVMMESEIIDGEAYFEDMGPGTYYLRMYLDNNQNQKWDTGNYRQEKKQAETSYYYPKPLRLRANWDVEEVWDYEETPFTEQLPEDLRPKK